MKVIVCLFFSFLILTSGCKKDKIRGQYFGTASALLNGTEWKAGKVTCTVDQGCYNGKLGIQFLVYSSEGYARESIGFHKIAMRTGLKKVYPINYLNACNDTLDGTYHTLTDDGDVTLDSYNAIPTSDNFLNIEKYDDVTKEIWGTFTIAYEILTRQSINSPDTIRITNGKFHTRIQE